MTLGIQPNIGGTIEVSIIRRQNWPLHPLKPTLQQGGGNRIKTSLDPVGLISSQHQPGLKRSLETASLERIEPYNDWCIEPNVAQLIRQSASAVELLCEQRIVEQGSQQRLQGNAVELQIGRRRIEASEIGWVLLW